MPSKNATVAHDAQGHWVLARLGKRVLRPGGVELTRQLLTEAHLGGKDCVELAPGLGRTASEIIAAQPNSYRGVDRDELAVLAVEKIVRGYGSVVVADAAQTGLESTSADVVIGEAMLTMQGESAKGAIVGEATRLLRPGGRYAIHELALTPDDLPEQVKTDVRQALARSIRVNARPLTIPEWTRVLTEHGLQIESIRTAPMALLQPRRLLADEGFRGVVRFVWNLARRPDDRRRVLSMRKTFRANREHLCAVAIVARKPA